MRQTLAKILLTTSRVLGAVAIMVDRKTVEDETMATLNRIANEQVNELVLGAVETQIEKPNPILEWGGYL